jgi:ABC-type Na+ transport system ATPase subunit NatA
MTAALVVDHLTKRYGPQTAVNDLSFSVEPGSICGFLGPNGAGKTSTIRMILGLIAPTSGRITVLGSESLRTVQDRIGFLPEERGLYKRMNPVDAVAFLASLKGVHTAEGKRRARAMLQAQGLGPHLKKPIKSLSKGMAQKVQLVAAVAHHPDLVILDEPFSGLDPVNQQALEEVIRASPRGAPRCSSPPTSCSTPSGCATAWSCWPRAARRSTVWSPRPAPPRRACSRWRAARTPTPWPACRAWSPSARSARRTRRRAAPVRGYRAGRAGPGGAPRHVRAGDGRVALRDEGAQPARRLHRAHGEALPPPAAPALETAA